MRPWKLREWKNLRKAADRIETLELRLQKVRDITDALLDSRDPKSERLGERLGRATGDWHWD